MALSDHVSLWLKTTSQPAFPTVESRTFDIVIVGGGIVGVCLAFHLRALGNGVLLIEGDEVLQGVTGYTTGKLTAQHGLIYSHILGTRGEELARAYADAQRWAIRFVDEQGIDCDLAKVDAHVFSTVEENDASMERESEAYAQLALDGGLDRSPDMGVGARRLLKLRDQRHFHPRKFLLGLLEMATAAGVQVMPHTRVHQIDETTEWVTLQTDAGQIVAGRVAVASHYPVHDSGLFVAKLTPIRSYATAFRIDAMPLVEMAISHEGEPERSWRPALYDEEPVLIVGANSHKVGEPPAVGDAYLELEQWARDHLPIGEAVARWSTQDNWTPDGVPFIGLSPNRTRIYVATGFAGWGMTNGIAAARLIADLMEGRESPWTDVFQPARMNLAMVPKLLRDNANTVGHLVGDRLARVPAGEPTELAPGEGRIVEVDGQRQAVYRSPEGALSALDPACTHMGCQVAWNELESTWDCPCHGSRFKATGEVIHGPATKALAPVEGLQA